MQNVWMKTLNQGWATPGTCGELATQALLSGM